MKKILILLLFLLTSSSFAVDVEAALVGSSYLQYTASANNDPEHTWQGRAAIAALHLSFDDADVASSLLLDIMVPSNSFNSGNFIRDANARASVFEARDYPEIIFRSQETTLKSLNQGRHEATVTGTLTMHGVAHELTAPVLLERVGDTLTVTGNFDILLSDFSMKRPSSFGNTVDDEVAIAFTIISTLHP